MQLTPEDIQKQQFHIRFRGFDVDEVDSFLEKVGENFLLLSKEKQELEERVDQLEHQLSEFREREKTFQNAILSTQKVADEIEAKSRREAEQRLQETRQEIDRIREETHTEVTSLEKQVEELKKTRTTVKKELREFLQSYLELLDQEAPDEKESTGPFPSAATSPVSRKDRLEKETAGNKFSYEAKSDAGLEEENDLYEKIDLPDDLDLPDLTGPQDDEEEEEDWEEKREEKENHPALNGKMLFNLEDPMDYESEPAVFSDDTSSEDLEENKKRGQRSEAPRD